MEAAACDTNAHSADRHRAAAPWAARQREPDTRRESRPVCGRTTSQGAGHKGVSSASSHVSSGHCSGGGPACCTPSPVLEGTSRLLSILGLAGRGSTSSQSWAEPEQECVGGLTAHTQELACLPALSWPPASSPFPGWPIPTSTSLATCAPPPRGMLTQLPCNEGLPPTTLHARDSPTRVTRPSPRRYAGGSFLFTDLQATPETQRVKCHTQGQVQVKSRTGI